MSDEKGETVKAYLSKIASELERLNREVRNLRVDVANLNQRIEPFDGEEDFKLDLSFAGRLAPKDFGEALQMIYKIQEIVRNTEASARQAAAKLDLIENDIVSREDMKKWLVPAKRQRKPID